jgi:hypothetical protein
MTDALYAVGKRRMETPLIPAYSASGSWPVLVKGTTADGLKAITIAIREESNEQWAR